MKRRSAKRSGDDLRAVYEVDYSKTTTNRFAGRLSLSRTVVLDPDVTSRFPTSRRVNAALRRLARIA